MPDNRSAKVPESANVPMIKIDAGIRTYHIDIKTNPIGKEYVLITEIGSDGSSQTRNSVAVFPRHMKALCEALGKVGKRLRPRLKAYDVEEIRTKYPRAYAAWTGEEELQLFKAYQANCDVNQLAKTFQRKPGAIKSRLRLLGLVPRLRNEMRCPR